MIKASPPYDPAQAGGHYRAAQESVVRQSKLQWRLKYKAWAILLCLACSLFAGSAQAAIAVLDAATTVSNDACDPCTMSSFTLSAGSNRKSVIFIGTEDSATNYTVSSVTFGGVTATLAVEKCDADPTSNLNCIYVYYINEADLPAPGTLDVVVDFSEAMNVVVVGVITFSGIASGAPTDTDSFQSASANSTSFTVTAASTDITVVASTINAQAGLYTWQAGASEIIDVVISSANNTARLGAAYELGETGPSVTNSGSATRFAAVVAVWPAAASVIPVAPIFFQ